MTHISRAMVRMGSGQSYICTVRLKKKYGQHFLKDPQQALRIAKALQGWGSTYQHLLEIGPGGGAMTEHLATQAIGQRSMSLVEIDEDLIAGLEESFGADRVEVINVDFLQVDMKQFPIPFGVVGNFPYNISSQILFKILENKEAIPEVVGMFQKEVAQRVAAKHGNKTYGILSVLIQAYYRVEEVFTLKPGAFNPPPKVDSMVIRLEKFRDEIPGVDAKDFHKMVKAAFGQRRKTLRNALGNYLGQKQPFEDPNSILQRRAEQLSVDEFLELNKQVNRQG